MEGNHGSCSIRDPQWPILHQIKSIGQRVISTGTNPSGIALLSQAIMLQAATLISEINTSLTIHTCHAWTRYPASIQTNPYQSGYDYLLIQCLRYFKRGIGMQLVGLPLLSNLRVSTRILVRMSSMLFRDGLNKVASIFFMTS